eukprot:scaffold6655_cov169-Amphora_coffeaeformis.AAC.17
MMTSITRSMLLLLLMGILLRLDIVRCFVSAFVKNNHNQGIFLPQSQSTFPQKNSPRSRCQHHRGISTTSRQRRLRQVFPLQALFNTSDKKDGKLFNRNATTGTNTTSNKQEQTNTTPDSGPSSSSSSNSSNATKVGTQPKDATGILLMDEEEEETYDDAECVIIYADGNDPQMFLNAKDIQAALKANDTAKVVHPKMSNPKKDMEVVVQADDANANTLNAAPNTTAVIQIKQPDKSLERNVNPRRKRRLILKAVNRIFTLVFACLVVYPMFSEEIMDVSRFGFSGQRPIQNRRREEDLPLTPRIISEKKEEDFSSSTGQQQQDLPEKGSSTSSDVTVPPGPDQNSVRANGGSSLDAHRIMALSFITEAVDRVGPSVVRIDTETDMSGPDDATEGPQIPRSPGFVQQGQGSGLIISADGLVLTNAHVVEHATRVSVTLTDGRVFSGKVTGSDEITDIACVRLVNGGSSSTFSADLPVAELGDSDKLQVGRLVIAVGSPGGLDNTVCVLP